MFYIRVIVTLANTCGPTLPPDEEGRESWETPVNSGELKPGPTEVYPTAPKIVKLFTIFWCLVGGLVGNYNVLWIRNIVTLESSDYDFFNRATIHI
jgi:hypothetical protein